MAEEKKPGVAKVVFENAEPAKQEEKDTEAKSTLGDRMSDMAGIRVLRNGKWETVSPTE